MGGSVCTCMMSLEDGKMPLINYMSQSILQEYSHAFQTMKQQKQKEYSF